MDSLVSSWRTRKKVGGTRKPLAAELNIHEFRTGYARTKRKQKGRGCFSYYLKGTHALYLEMRSLSLNRETSSHADRVIVLICIYKFVISRHFWNFVRSFRVSLLARCFRSLSWNDLRRKVRLVELKL